MAIIRKNIVKGPAVVEYRGSKFYAKGDIKMTVAYDTMPIESSVHGKLDERITARRVDLSFEPIGQLDTDSSTLANVLWPYAKMKIGKSIFTPESYDDANTDADFPLVITTLAGKTITLPSAAITKMPTLTLSAIKTALGSITFTGMGKDNTNWEDANSLFEFGTGTADLSDFDLAKIRTVPYTAEITGGPTGFTSFKTISGFTIDFNMSTKPIETDTDGQVDMVFESLQVDVKCQPLGMTAKELIDAMLIQGNSYAKRGASLQKQIDHDLVIFGSSPGDPKVTITKVGLKSGGLDFGAATPNIGEVTFIATRTFTGSDPDDLFTIEQVA